MIKRGVSTVVGIALAASACSVVGGSDDAGGSGGEDDVGAASASPLSSFLGMDGVADVESEAGQARIIEIQREINESVVACMAAQGFEYVPPNPDDTVSFSAAVSSNTAADGIEWGSPEYTARFGFGVTTMRWPQSTVGPDLVGYTDDEVVFDDTDPNQAYLDGLSDAERAAYDTALYGNVPEYRWDDSLSDEENQAQAEDFYRGLEPSGCFAEAEATSAYANVSAFYEAFGDELFDLYDQIENDPRITERLLEIKSCVEDKGLEFVDPDNAWQRWDEALRTIDEQHVTWPPNEIDQSELDAMSPEQLDELYASPAVMDDEGKALLAELQAEEIAVAVATDECGGSTQELSSLYLEISAEYEQRFLDDNADAVAEFGTGGA